MIFYSFKHCIAMQSVKQQHQYNYVECAILFKSKGIFNGYLRQELFTSHALLQIHHPIVYAIFSKMVDNLRMNHLAAMFICGVSTLMCCLLGIATSPLLCLPAALIISIACLQQSISAVC